MNNIGKGPFRNPYDFDQPSNPHSNHLRKRKLPHKSQSRIEEIVAPVVQTNGVSWNTINDEVQEIRRVGHEDRIPVDSIVRWLKPTSHILMRIVQDRVELSRRLRPEVQFTQENLPKNLVYILILNDELFDPIDFIFKYKINVDPKLGLNSKLEKLFVPKELMEKGDPFTFNCFLISVTKAKCYNLKLKSRKRRKKRKIHQIKVLQTPIDNLDNEEIMEIDKRAICSIMNGLTPVENPDIENEIQTIVSPVQSPIAMEIDEEVLQQPCVLRTRPSFTHEAFSPNMHISTELLHNYRHSFTGKWPTDNPISTAIEFPNKREGVIFLLSSIFKINVGNQLFNVAYSDKELEGMEKIATQVINFHAKLKTLTRLVRQCLANWILKHNRKEKIREERKKKGKDKKEAEIQRRLEISKTLQVPTSPTIMGCSYSFSFSFPNQSTLSSFASAASYNISNVTMSSGLGGASFELSNQNPSSQSVKSIIAEELKKKIPHKCILSTISQILHLSGALKFVGSNKNKRGFMKFLKQTLSLAGMKSSLQLGQLMALLDPDECPYLNKITHPASKLCAFSKIMTWLMRDYVLVLIRTHFHVTESNFDRNKYLYYLVHTWMDLKQELKKRFLANKFLRPMNIYMNPQNRDLKMLRYIPKKDNTVRAILRDFNVTKQSRYLPKMPNLVLKYIGSKIAPHGTSEASAIQEKWRVFLKNWKSIKFPQLYFARVDIKDAYPSVDLNLLAKILKDFVNKNKNRQVYLKEFFRDQANYRIKKFAIFDNEDRASWESGNTPKPAFLQCTKSTPSIIDISKVVEGIIAKFLCYVQVGAETYEFNYGLPQGWSLSYALCNIYYGGMEAQYLPNISKNIDFFVRSVDDYFFVSPNPLRVSKFLLKMKKGFPDYRARINESKSLTNLFVRSDIPSPVAPHNFVQFFGHQFCTTTGHVARDFSGYAGQDICSTITFNVKSKSPEIFIFERMGMFLPARLVPPLFDPRINCECRICLNIYDIALMFAFRFYAMCRVVLPNLNALNDPQKSKILLNSIKGFASILGKRLEKIQTSSQFHRYKKAKHNCSNGAKCALGFKGKNWKKIFINGQRNPRANIQLNEIQLLVFQAFISKMKRHFGVFRDNLLPKLYHLRKLTKIELGPKRSSYLLEITGRGSFPLHFQNIKV